MREALERFSSKIKDSLNFVTWNAKLLWAKYQTLRSVLSSAALHSDGIFASVVLPIISTLSLSVTPVLCVIVLHVIIDTAITVFFTAVKLAAKYVMFVMVNFIKYSLMMVAIVWLLNFMIPTHGPFRVFLKKLFSKIKRRIPGFHLVEEHKTYPMNETTSDLNSSTLCVVCMSDPKCVMLLPCRHLCLCTLCSDQIIQEMNTCPLCRANITDTVQAFM